MPIGEPTAHEVSRATERSVAICFWRHQKRTAQCVESGWIASTPTSRGLAMTADGDFQSNDALLNAFVILAAVSLASPENKRASAP